MEDHERIIEFNKAVNKTNPKTLSYILPKMVAAYNISNNKSTEVSPLLGGALFLAYAVNQELTERIIRQKRLTLNNLKVDTSTLLNDLGNAYKSNYNRYGFTGDIGLQTAAEAVAEVIKETLGSDANTESMAMSNLQRLIDQTKETAKTIFPYLPEGQKEFFLETVIQSNSKSEKDNRDR